MCAVEIAELATLHQPTGPICRPNVSSRQQIEMARLLVPVFLTLPSSLHPVFVLGL